MILAGNQIITQAKTKPEKGAEIKTNEIVASFSSSGEHDKDETKTAMNIKPSPKQGIKRLQQPAPLNSSVPPKKFPKVNPETDVKLGDRKSMLSDDEFPETKNCSPIHPLPLDHLEVVSAMGKKQQTSNNLDSKSTFVPIPSTTMECYCPTSTSFVLEQDEKNMDNEVLYILESIPKFIKAKITSSQLDEHYEQHCTNVVSEKMRSLVKIDGGRFEFYICKHKTPEQDKECLFDHLIMNPFLDEWDCNGVKQRLITNSGIFRTQLHRYISRAYGGDYFIHSISFILDYPSENRVRQWSHIDGEATMYQGSVLCGNGTPITMEFPFLNPPVKNDKDLKQAWKFLPENSIFYNVLCKNDYCLQLLEMYGTLFHHHANKPKNPVSAQKKGAAMLQSNKTGYTKNWDSAFPAGTIIRMKGNTIHAGPSCSRHQCRAIFFYAASPIQSHVRYDPDNQWNQVTLASAILLEVWSLVPVSERVMILEYIRSIQCNPKIAPSDTSLFVTNFTLRLFIRISVFLKCPKKNE
jgi:hypothetical protein